MALCRTNPAFFGQHNRQRIRGGQFKLTEGLCLFALSDGRSAVVTVSLNHGFQLALDQGLEPRITAQGFLQPVALLRELILLAADFHFFKLGEVTQLQIKDGFCLHIRDLEGFHKHRFGLFLLADNADDLVNVEKRGEVTLENMESALYPLQPMLQAALDRRLSERQPLLQDRHQRLHRRPTVDANHIEVHPISALKISGGKKMAHDPVDIDAIGPGYQYQPGGVFMIGLVAQIRHHRQFAGLHLRSDLLQYLGARDLIGQRVNHHRTVLDGIGRPHPQRATARFVKGFELVRRSNDFGFCRKVRPFDVLAQV